MRIKTIATGVLTLLFLILALLDFMTLIIWSLIVYLNFANAVLYDFDEFHINSLNHFRGIRLYANDYL